MSKGIEVCLNEYIVKRGDMMRVYNPDEQDYFYVRVLEAENLDDRQNVKFIVMKTGGGYVASMTFEYIIHKDVEEKDKIRAIVWPEETSELELPEYIQSSLEEIVLHKIIEFLHPLSLRNKGTYEKVVREYLASESIIPPDLKEKDVKALIGRAIALMPHRFVRKGGWLKLAHVAGATKTTPNNPVTVAKTVSKSKLTSAVSDFVVAIVESGILGPVEWTK